MVVRKHNKQNISSTFLLENQWSIKMHKKGAFLWRGHLAVMIRKRYFCACVSYASKLRYSKKMSPEMISLLFFILLHLTQVAHQLDLGKYSIPVVWKSNMTFYRFVVLSLWKFREKWHQIRVCICIHFLVISIEAYIRSIQPRLEVKFCGLMQTAYKNNEIMCFMHEYNST